MGFNEISLPEVWRGIQTLSAFVGRGPITLIAEPWTTIRDWGQAALDWDWEIIGWCGVGR